MSSFPVSLSTKLVKRLSAGSYTTLKAVFSKITNWPAPLGEPLPDWLIRDGTKLILLPALGHLSAKTAPQLSLGAVCRRSGP